MQIPKPSDADKEHFRSIVPDDPRVEVKPMFGNLAAFVNGNMFMGLFGSDVGVRLDEEERAELYSVDGASEFGPQDRPMKEYVSVPPAWRAGDERLGRWIERALDHVATMPAKQPKKKK